MSQDLEYLDDETSVNLKLEKGMLTLATETQETESNTSGHIKSWVDGYKPPIEPSPDSDNNIDMLPTFEVVQTRIIDEAGQKKHVAYTVMVKNSNESNSGVIERRYTDFLKLYKTLRKEFPLLTSNISFPKKVFIGNFAPGVISMRSICFELFLKSIIDKELLKESPSLKLFLCAPEEKEAKNLIERKQYLAAKSLLENCFHIYNKIYTNRHPFVVISLCRLVACCNAEPALLTVAYRYAELALHRFEGVSDTDLLRYYVPLLQLCVHLWWKLGKEKKFLDVRLENLRRVGHNVDNCPSLLDAMMDSYI